MKPFHQWLGDLTEDLREKEKEKEAIITVSTENISADEIIEDLKYYVGNMNPSIIQPVAGQLWDASDFYEFDGELHWPCTSCGKMIEINCDPIDFDEDFHYCGGSPSCCP